MAARRHFFVSLFVLLAIASVLAACARVKVKIGPEADAPLKEYIIEGKEREKVLVVPIRGFISDAPGKHLLGERPSMVQEVVSQLRLAEKDKEIKAVLLEINSPGGFTTASDILYHEISAFKKRTDAKMVAVLMDVAASGGYYVALAADRIIAHPTTVTGSIGVILIKPKVAGLMDKLGLAVEVNKSGREKDMGSPFRPSTAEEQRILQDLTDGLGKRFLDLVAVRRRIQPQALNRISTARIYLGEEALQLRLVDAIGYLNDALSAAKTMAGLPEDARVVVYRRVKYHNDNLYNTSTAWHGIPGLSLIDTNLADVMPALSPGFYYLWLSGSHGH